MKDTKTKTPHKTTLIKFNCPNWVQGFIIKGKRYFHPYTMNGFIFDHQKKQQDERS